MSISLKEAFELLATRLESRARWWDDYTNETGEATRAKQDAVLTIAAEVRSVALELEPYKDPCRNGMADDEQD